jgi:prevent-host-death family protein
MEIGVKEARAKFSSLLERVIAGEEVIITRRDKQVARLVPVTSKGKEMVADQKKFRDSIRVAGRPTSELVTEGREEEWY